MMAQRFSINAASAKKLCRVRAALENWQEKREGTQGERGQRGEERVEEVLRGEEGRERRKGKHHSSNGAQICCQLLWGKRQKR